MAKKASKTLLDATLEYQEEYEFKKFYDIWLRTCEGISSEQIMSSGRTKDGKKVRTTPNTLYGQLEEHVTAAFRRPNSKNKGDDGTYKLLEAIRKFMNEEYKGILLEVHRETLAEFSDKLEKFEGNSSYNPKRIHFTRPARYVKTGNKKGQAIGSKTIKIYGHYADKFYEAKYKGKEGYQGKAPDSWYSEDIDGPQNPPLAQALFGKGELVKIGLITIIDRAIEELDNEIDNISINAKRPSELRRIPSVRKHVFSLLKNKSMFRKGGRPNLGKMAQSFVGMRFALMKGRSKSAASPKRIIAFVGKIPEPSGEINTFSLTNKFKETAMASLIRAVIGKETYKLRWGEHLNMKGMKVPKKTTEENKVEKAWFDYLWRN